MAGGMVMLGMPEETLEVIKAISRATGLSMPEVISKALDDLQAKAVAKAPPPAPTPPKAAPGAHRGRR